MNKEDRVVKGTATLLTMLSVFFVPVNNEFLSFFTDEHRQTVNMGSIVTVAESQSRREGILFVFLLSCLLVFTHPVSGG